MHHNCIDYLLTTRKEKNMKNQLTTNQQKAMNILDDQVITQSDFVDEGGAYVILSDLIEILVGEGWSTKSAEGTIGSLCETKHLDLFERAMDNFPFNPSWARQDTWWLSL
tara:strand:+ start:185 stop:514 length:330 start_codon:yes stop_codon:yes gene_type:complete